MITLDTRAAAARARRLPAEGRSDEAETLARDYLARQPDDGRWIEVLGLAWHAQGRRHSARWALETALMLTPLGPEALFALAELYASGHRPRDAHVSLSLLAERKDLPVELLPHAAALFGRLGDARSALALCRRSIDADPDCDEALFGAAFYMRRLGFPAEMVAAVLRRAVRLDPSCCLYRRTLAAALTALGELTEAYELYRDVAPEQVCCAGCLRTMIDVFDRTGDAARSEACSARLEAIAQAIEESPVAQQELHRKQDE